MKKLKMMLIRTKAWREVLCFSKLQSPHAFYILKIGYSKDGMSRRMSRIDLCVCVWGGVYVSISLLRYRG